jgi:DNA-binding MarR family transcriptional regulator
MSFTPTTVKFNLDLPARDSTGPINDFGQHKFVVLRKLSEMRIAARAELLTALIMSDAQATAALDKLVDAGMVREVDGFLTLTEAGASKLLAL